MNSLELDLNDLKPEQQILVQEWWNRKMKMTSRTSRDEGSDEEQFDNYCDEMTIDFLDLLIILKLVGVTTLILTIYIF